MMPTSSIGARCIAGGTLLEMFKRRSDRRGAAYALAGAVRASVREVVQFKVVETMTEMAAKLKADPHAPFTAGKMFQESPIKFNLAVFEKYIDRLGLLSPELSERTVLWFSGYAGFQHALWKTLHRCETNEAASKLIDLTVAAWAAANEEASQLAADLQRSADWYRLF
jgi:hypothetical protein